MKKVAKEFLIKTGKSCEKENSNDIENVPGKNCQSQGKEIEQKCSREKLSNKGQTIPGNAEGVDWEKGSLLGKGAYGTCYKANMTKTGAVFAVKQIQMSKHQDSHHMIEEEIRINSKLKHDHIIRMFGAGQGGIHMNIFFECMHV